RGLHHRADPSDLHTGRTQAALRAPSVGSMARRRSDAEFLRAELLDLANSKGGFAPLLIPPARTRLRGQSPRSKRNLGGRSLAAATVAHPRLLAPGTVEHPRLRVPHWSG